MEGENHIVAALGLSKKAGVVTDAYHYDASLVLYGELGKRGVPVTCLAPKNNRIELEDVERAITSGTKLVAVSHVGSDTGHQHDLKALCDYRAQEGRLRLCRHHPVGGRDSTGREGERRRFLLRRRLQMADG